MLSPPSWSCKQGSDFSLVTPTPHRVGSRCLSKKRLTASGGLSASPLRRRSLASATRCYACTVFGLSPVCRFSFMFTKQSAFCECTKV